ncbi:glucose-6-phosphatase-like protein, partial [Dinothrombium tinctorium]
MDSFREIRILEVDTIVWVQNKLASFESLFLSGCHIGDPRYPYLYASFFLATVSEVTALKLFWGVVVSEYLNIFLKWIFNDHRPYWWVPEYLPFFETRFNIKLKQFDITCETGPGMPSGHIMVTTCMWFILYRELVRKRILKTTANKILVLVIMALGICIVGFGRVYISAHFPDQCLFGFASGILTAFFLEKWVSEGQCLKMSHHYLTSFVIISSLYSLYFLLNNYSSSDANWSFKMAEKWCFDRAYVKLDTAPLFVMFRTSSTIIGTGFAFLALSKYLQSSIDRPLIVNDAVRVIIGGISFFVSSFFLQYTKPSASATAGYFYAVTFVQYLFLPAVSYLTVWMLHYLLAIR